MAQRTCSIEGCERPSKSRGWCRMHYLRWYRHGSTDPLRKRDTPLPPPCSVDGCDRISDVKGICNAHLQRLQRLGDLQEDKPIRQDTFEERFWFKVDAGGDCWEWTGAIMRNGYGSVRRDDKTELSHRVAWELLVGPIPEGLTMDHLCRNRKCVNPDHLEPVTFKENVLRGVSPQAINARKTHCKRGHFFSEKNTYVSDNGRACRECRRLRLADA